MLAFENQLLQIEVAVVEVRQLSTTILKSLLVHIVYFGKKTKQTMYFFVELKLLHFNKIYCKYVNTSFFRNDVIVYWLNCLKTHMG